MHENEKGTITNDIETMDDYTWKQKRNYYEWYRDTTDDIETMDYVWKLKNKELL